MNITLNIGRHNDGSYWLCMANADNGDVWPIAKFQDTTAQKAFSMWMQANGFNELPLASDESIENLFT